ncbi:FtsX-like permease family protein [Kitasatospora sp. NPDC049285]|uniref:ABC transporter permease n=1 Tax=Kitasatospora sp. NPDC049285 TaxID=3157096 RepID=UPI003415FC7E
MSALGTVLRAGVRRRRVQTAVTGLAAMMAVTASVLGGSLLVASDAPFDHAFARQHGPHLTVQLDAAKATAEQVGASAHAAGVTVAAGPFRTVSTNPSGVPGQALPAGMSLPPMALVGRDAPGGPVDQVTLTEGHWVSGPGQIVVSADYSGPQLAVGGAIAFPTASGGSAELRIVGLARSVGRTADGWIAPAQVDALDAHGTGAGYQMLYRFAGAGTDAQLADDRAAVTARLPANSLTGATSWLNVRNGNSRSTGLFIPFLTAFGLLGIAMSVLIVGNVVAGAVGSGTRRIGILKAVGFTPGQVVRAHLGQALIPAAVGTLLGAVLGNLAAGTVLSATEQVYGTDSLTVAPWVDAAVILGTLALVAVTALVAALRAGRLRTVDALAVGRTPRLGRGRRAARIARALPLPRAVTMGLAQPFARPARALAMVVAILFGATAVTFAYGLATSLQRIEASKQGSADVTVLAVPPPLPGASAAGDPRPDTAAMAQAVERQPGTLAYYGAAQTEVTAAGSTSTVTVTAYLGDSSWAARPLVTGRWFHGAGEAVAPTPFLTATGTRVGDTVMITDHGTTLPVRITGEAFVADSRDMQLFTDAATLAGAEPDLHADYFDIKLTPGTATRGYTDGLNAALRSTGAVAHTGDGGGSSQLVVLLDALTGLLTLMLVAVAGLGVLNTVVVDTRERIRDLGVVKALGMTPRQTVSMVVASVTVIGLVGGAIGVPLGVLLQRIIVPAMGHSAGRRLPTAMVEVYQTPTLALLGLGGVVIAVLGALLPAGWAARTRTAVALRTE